MRSRRRRIAPGSDMPRWLRPGHALHSRDSSWRRLLGAVLAVIGLGAAAFVAAQLDPLPPRFTGVARVSDGDSFWVGRDRVRLAELDAPELDQVCWRENGAEWPCGREARAFTARLLDGGRVECQPRDLDRFGRTVADCTVAGRNIGAQLVRAGLAVSKGGYEIEQRGAREERLGIWSGRFIDPREWRDEGPRDDPGPGLLEMMWTWFRELTGATAVR